LLLTATAEEKAILKGRVVDAEGKAVKGAAVLVYDSPEVRRRADFESARTEGDGKFRMVLLPGKYWTVARFKKVEGFGPLRPGDKHSGEPREVELASGAELETDLKIEDIKAVARNKPREDYFKIKGRILDEKGLPVSKVYAIANRKETFSGLPDYLSAWTDEEGHYTLYLPRGKYYAGAAAAFPPGGNYFMNKVLVIDSDRSDVNISGK